MNPVNAVDAAAGALADAGYEVAEVDVPVLDDALAVYTGMVLTEFAGNWPAISALVVPDASRYINFDLDEHPPLDLEHRSDDGSHLLEDPDRLVPGKEFVHQRSKHMPRMSYHLPGTALQARVNQLPVGPEAVGGVCDSPGVRARGDDGVELNAEFDVETEV
ncbi:hypothetical protein [Saccharopolyspora sp. NPDC003762]